MARLERERERERLGQWQRVVGGSRGSVPQGGGGGSWTTSFRANIAMHATGSRCVDNGICFVCSGDLTKCAPPILLHDPLPLANSTIILPFREWQRFMALFVQCPRCPRKPQIHRYIPCPCRSVLVLFFMWTSRCDSKCASRGPWKMSGEPLKWRVL